MRGCRCTGMTLCPQCQALAERAFALPGAPPVQAHQPPAISHTAFRTAIWRLSKQHGWKMYYTKNARKSPVGFPDIILARAYEPVIYAELKIPPDTLSIEQEQWLAILALARTTETYVWKPEDWPRIDARLTQPMRSPV